MVDYVQFIMIIIYDNYKYLDNYNIVLYVYYSININPIIY